MKTFALVMVIALFFTLSFNAMAGEKHHNQLTTNNYQTSIKGVALAISAAQCSFDNGSSSLQLCGAVGYYENQEAVTFGIGKKYKSFLLNGTISTESGQTAIGVGLNWKLK